MSRVVAAVRSLLIVLLFAQSFAVGAMEVRAALMADAASTMTHAADDELLPCHRTAKADSPSSRTADCCSNGACRCLGLMLALPQVAMMVTPPEAPSCPVVVPMQSQLPDRRPERPLRPPSA